MYKPKLIIAFGFLIFVSFSFLLKSDISAADFKTSGAVLEVNINKDYSISLKSSVVLENTTKTNVISGYELILPVEIENKKIIKAKLGKTPVEVKTIKSTNNISTVELNFGGNVIKPKSKQTLVVEVSLPNYFIQIGELRYASFSSVNINFEKLIVTYDKRLEEPSILIGNEDSNFVNNKIEIIKPISLIIGFGDEYSFGVESKFDLVNNSNEKISTTWNLIPEINSEQTVNYVSVQNADYALSSIEFNSVNAVTKIEKEDKVKVGFTANITKYNTKIQKAELANLPIFKLSEKVEKDIEKISKLNVTNFQKASLLQDYIVSNFSLKANLTHNTNDIDKYLRSLKPGMELSSLESCLILGHIKDSSLQIEYGYSLLSTTQKGNKTPHFWCLISDKDKTQIFDPFLEYSTSIDYSNLESKFDRVTVGTWVYGDLVSNNLGLTALAESLHPIKTSETQNVQSQLKVVADYDKTTQFMPSGLFFSINFNFENFSSKLLSLNAIKTNSFKFHGSLGPVNDYAYTILPKQNTKITLNRFRIENFLNNNKKKDQIKFLFNNDVESEVDVNLYFKAHTEAIFASIAIVNVIGFSLIFIAWKRFLKNAK